MKWILIMLLGIFVAGSSLAEIYTYKDKQGKVVFSDVPVKGAEKVIVPPVMTYEGSVQKSTIDANGSFKPTKLAEHQPYKRLVIAYPEQEGTVRDNQGELTIRYTLSPALQKGDKVEVFLNGEEHDGLELKGLDRGEHTVRLQVVDANGYAHVTSEDVVFYLHHQSKLF
ncbi:MAG: DUF4124 domain-containing protein [Piscirickettsiaceae bacterium]|nr:MAG: DUF4124 domain-containing protein [Piscirickettsiaceae bacterium]